MLYIAQTDTLGYAKLHYVWVVLTSMFYSPVAIALIMNMMNDTKNSRKGMAGAMELGGIAAMSTNWVGLWSFCMYASDATVLDEGENTPWIFIYFVLNGALLFMHVWFSPAIYEWAKKDPPAPAAEPVAEATEEPSDTDGSFEW